MAEDLAQTVQDSHEVRERLTSKGTWVLTIVPTQEVGARKGRRTEAYRQLSTTLEHNGFMECCKHGMFRHMVLKCKPRFAPGPRRPKGDKMENPWGYLGKGRKYDGL